MEIDASTMHSYSSLNLLAYGSMDRVRIPWVNTILAALACPALLPNAEISQPSATNMKMRWSLIDR